MRIDGKQVLAVVALSAAVMGGCESSPTEKEVRDNPSGLIKGDTGLQSKDLIEMTDKMGPSIIASPDIAQNPYKVVVVMMGIQNHTANPGEDLTIYTARIRARLNRYATDKVAFVENRATTENLQAAEGATGGDPFGESGRAGVGAPGRIVPTHALKGVFYEKTNGATSFYLCTFQLTNMKTGQIVWEDSYEVRTLR